MIRVMQFLWSGCWHRWEEVEGTHRYDGAFAVGPATVCRCTKCKARKIVSGNPAKKEDRS